MVNDSSVDVNFEAFKESIRKEYVEESGIHESFFEQIAFCSSTEIGTDGTVVKKTYEAVFVNEDGTDWGSAGKAVFYKDGTNS